MAIRLVRFIKDHPSGIKAGATRSYIKGFCEVLIQDGFVEYEGGKVEEKVEEVKEEPKKQVKKRAPRKKTVKKED